MFSTIKSHTGVEQHEYEKIELYIKLYKIKLYKIKLYISVIKLICLLLATSHFDNIIIMFETLYINHNV